MDWLRASFISGIAVSVLGCATPMPRTVSVQSSSGVETFYSAGNSCGSTSIARGEEGLVRVSVCAVPLDTKRARINLGVWNESPHAVTLLDTGISAGSSAGPLKVFRYADLLAEEKRRQTWAAVGAGLAAGANAYNASQAGYSTTTGSVSGNYSGYSSTGGYERGKVSGTYSSTTYDAGAAQRAQADASAQNQVLFNQLSSQASANTAAIETMALRSQTVAPGDSTFGSVLVALPKKLGTGQQSLTVAIAVEDDQVRFDLSAGD